MESTQTRHPWRTVARTVFEMVVALAAAMPLVFEAIYQRDPASLTGAAAVVLAVSAAITRVMALPAVNEFLARFAPFLAPEKPASD